MLTQQRKQHLLRILKRDGHIVAKEVAGALHLSEDTIRRDLRELAKGGLLQRVHGGALPASQAVQNFHARKSISRSEKTAIGRAAANMIQPGQVVFIDGGTSTTQLVRHLPLTLKATIVTHSPSIAVELIDHAAEVQLIGGRLFKHSMVSVGAEAADAIRRIRADNYFMGVTGIHPEIGLSTGDGEEAIIKRIIAESSADVTVLGSPEKLGAASPYVIMPCEMMTTLIVLESTAKPQIKDFRSQGVEIISANSPP